MYHIQCGGLVARDHSWNWKCQLCGKRVEEGECQAQSTGQVAHYGDAMIQIPENPPPGEYGWLQVSPEEFEDGPRSSSDAKDDLDHSEVA
jgi:hypothetical protein